MKTEKIGKYTVEIYDSIDELPIKRFHKFNKYVLVDSGIGSDLNDINTKISRIAQFIEKEPESAKLELENLRQSLYMITEEINLKHLSLIPLIKSINGKEVHDLSDENIKFLLKKLSSVNLGFFNRLVESVKKKIDSEITLFFPSQFGSSLSKEYHDKLRERSLKQLEGIIKNKDNKAAIDKIDEFLLTFTKPKKFSGKESMEIQYEKDFEEMCIFLQKELSMDMDKTTVSQFYTALGYIKKLNKKKK